MREAVDLAALVDELDKLDKDRDPSPWGGGVADARFSAALQKAWPQLRSAALKIVAESVSTKVKK